MIESTAEAKRLNKRVDEFMQNQSGIDELTHVQKTKYRLHVHARLFNHYLPIPLREWLKLQ